MKQSKRPDRLTRKHNALIVSTYERLLRIGEEQGRSRTVEMVKARMAERYKSDPEVFARWKQYAAEA
jgi:hypothetical protein